MSVIGKIMDAQASKRITIPHEYGEKFKNALYVQVFDHEKGILVVPVKIEVEECQN